MTEENASKRWQLKPNYELTLFGPRGFSPPKSITFALGEGDLFQQFKEDLRMVSGGNIQATNNKIWSMEKRSGGSVCITNTENSTSVILPALSIQQIIG